MPPTPRRSPRAAAARARSPDPGSHAAAPRGRSPQPGAAASRRPLTVPFAMAFTALVVAEELYLGWLLWEPDPGWHWYVFATAGLVAWAVAGAVLVWRGRPRGWLVLAGAATVPLLGLVALAVLFGALGGGQALWWALLMLAGPAGCLALAAGRPIREWTRPGRATRTARHGRRQGRAR